MSLSVCKIRLVTFYQKKFRSGGYYTITLGTYYTILLVKLKPKTFLNALIHYQYLITAKSRDGVLSYTILLSYLCTVQLY